MPPALARLLFHGYRWLLHIVLPPIHTGEYNYAIAFQERIKLPAEKMAFYEDLAEMYVGDDVSPDFYAWVFPKYDHVGVGTGTVVNRPAIKQYQKGIRDRAAQKIEGGKVRARVRCGGVRCGFGGACWVCCQAASVNGGVLGR